MVTGDVITTLKVDVLKVLAQRAGLPRTLTRKADLVRALGNYLDSNLSDFLQQLTDRERTFLTEAVHNQGRVVPEVFKARYRVECPRAGRWIDPRRASLLHLMITEDEYERGVFIPETLADVLRPLLSRPPEVSVKTVEDVPAVFPEAAEGNAKQRAVDVFQGEQSVFAELGRVLHLVQAGKVRAQTKGRRPTSGTERLLSGVLSGADFDVEPPPEERDEYTELAGPIRAHAWAVLVQQCGWCKPRAGKLTLTKAGKEMVCSQSPDDFCGGVECFIFDERFDELNRINHIRGQSGKGKRGTTDPSERKDAICDSTGQWPVNRWVAFDEAERFIYASENELTVTKSPWYLYLSEHRYGHLADYSSELNRQYLRALLFESLATLGLIDIAYTYPHWLWPEMGGSWGAEEMEFCGRYDGLLYARLNPLGAFCLGDSDSYEPPAVPRRNLLKVLPNREVAVTSADEFSAADCSMLDMFAKRKSDHVWRLDSQRILGHVENGGSIDDLVEFLSKNSDDDVPHTVHVYFKELADKAGALVGAEEAMLIQMRDDTTAALVAHDVRAGKLCLVAGDRHLVVRKKNERAFRSAVKRLGYVLPQ